MKLVLKNTFIITIIFAIQIMLPYCSVKITNKPNILFIITDDQGYGDLSIHGNPYIHTPNIDRIGEMGVRFDRFYVSSVCAPSRASILTGRYSLRTGTHGVTNNREAMRPEEVTIAEALKTAGYRTACIGKWHNGIQFPYNPAGQGFDEFIGFTGGHINQYFDAVLIRGTRPEKTSCYIADVLTDEAIKFIENSKSQPFFCYLSYNTPHSPYQVPDKYYDRFKDQGFNETISAIWGMCENIDENVGRLLSKLEQLGITDNTLVIFLTDNGGVGTINIYNAGMRGGKTSVHEGGSRVPLFMMWPAAKWDPHIVKMITAHIDLYPTLLDICGIKPVPGPPVDGISLRPLLESSNAEWPERTLFLHNPIDETNRYPGAVRTPKYRLVRKTPGPQAGSAAKNNDVNALPWELYDMDVDPGEEKNLADSFPGLVTELSYQYEQWLDDISINGLGRFPLPVGYDEHNPVQLEASQAYFTSPIRYASGRGFANDWLTGWNDIQGKIWFEIDVVKTGKYAVEIAYICPTEDAGSALRISAGKSSIETIISSAPIVSVLLPHRDQDSAYKSREWAMLHAGYLTLSAGQQKIILEAMNVKGGMVMDLKNLSIKRVD